MTLTQKILARKAGLQSVQPGDLIKVKLDLVLGNDITTPVAIAEMKAHGLNRVFDREKIALVMDHFTPNKDIASATQCAAIRAFVREHGIKHFYDVGQMGIEHVILPEKGLAAPGEMIIGADSHTCTYGALGAFATGVGSTDMAAGMATGECWLRVPEAIKVTLKGTLKPPLSGKDIILHLIGELGVDGARYMSLEFFGAENIPMDDRLTISNMAIECGAKNGIFPVDDITRDYLKSRVNRLYVIDLPDSNAHYSREVVIELNKLRPLVAKPHLPSNISPASEMNGVKVDQVVIGSCTNGRISDLRIAADILRGKKVAEGVRCIVIPGSQQVMLDAVSEGLVADFINAGAAVSTPTCGPCLGGHMGILAEGEVCVSTTNRNFVGRMGHTKSHVYLASPAVAASSALTGFITAPSVGKGKS